MLERPQWPNRGPKKTDSEDRAPACTLLVFIDDATGRLMTLHFTQTESTFSYFEALSKYLGAQTTLLDEQLHCAEGDIGCGQQ